MFPKIRQKVTRTERISFSSIKLLLNSEKRNTSLLVYHPSQGMKLFPIEYLYVTGNSSL